MFSSYEEAYSALLGCFRKFKSYCYYNRNIAYLKPAIAKFECEGYFEQRLSDLAKYVFEENDYIFDSLVPSINFYIKPKAFEEVNNSNALVSNNIKDVNKIKSVNFFFCAEAELFILDTLWTCLMAKIALNKSLQEKEMYGNRISSKLLDDGEIDFGNKELFARYFSFYNAWRDDSFSSFKKEVDKGKDCVLYSLDLKGYYYNCAFDKDKLYSIFDNSTELKEFEFLTNGLLKLYFLYTKNVSDYREGLDETVKRRQNVFPIGLPSSCLLSNLYLRDFDNTIKSKLSGFVHYARYVDDILIVKRSPKEISKSDKDPETLKSKLLDEFLKKGIFLENDDEIYLSDFENLKIQKSKIACIHISASSHKKTNLFKVYDSLFKNRPSTVDFSPDFEFYNKSFNSVCYELNNNESGYKVKKLANLFPHNKSITKYIYNYLNCSIGTTEKINKNDEDSNLSSIVDYFTSTQSVQYFKLWETISYILVICGQKRLLESFYTNGKSAITRIKASEVGVEYIKKSKVRKVIGFLRETLKFEFRIFVSAARCLYGQSDGDTLITLLRKSNLFNDGCALYPLSNFAIDNGINLIEPFDYDKTIELDISKLYMSPRFIHYYEFNLYNCWSSLLTNHPKYSEVEIEELFNKYNDIKYRENILIRKRKEFKNYNLDFLYINSPKKVQQSKIKPIKISICNINYSNAELISWIKNKNAALKSSYKRELFSLVKNAIANNSNYIVFPELIVPFEWLKEMAFISKNYQIGIIGGVQYITCNKNARNYSFVIESTKNKRHQRYSVVYLREKNDYAPLEQFELKQIGFALKIPLKSTYSIIHKGAFNYSVFICFELTDIRARALMKGRINTLFITEFNPDTIYYSNLVESVSRDLSCFCVQVNTSYYGDSRITGPYKSEAKDIVKVKGGVSNSILTGDIDLHNLIEHNKDTRDPTPPLKKSKINSIKKDIKKMNIQQLKSLRKDIEKLLPNEKPLPARWGSDDDEKIF